MSVSEYEYTSNSRKNFSKEGINETLLKISNEKSTLPFMD